MASSKIIRVIGSINKDLVYYVSHMPAAGETLTANKFEQNPGGKGANQAVAASRLSSNAPDIEVHMIGAVGGDGKDMIDGLKVQKVGTAEIRLLDQQSSGNAMIIVEETTGENRIVLSPGTNHSFTPAHFTRAENLGSPWPDLIVLQLEIPLDTVMQILKTAKAASVDVLLNPAPAVKLEDDAYQSITHLILNETEAAILTNRDLSEVEAEGFNWKAVADEFLAKGVKNVVITLGSKGAYFATSSTSGLVPAEKIPKEKVVDTTAAGDTFVGAAAVKLVRKGKGALLEKDDVLTCCRAAGKTVQKYGAIPSIPFGNEVDGM